VRLKVHWLCIFSALMEKFKQLNWALNRVKFSLNVHIFPFKLCQEPLMFLKCLNCESNAHLIFVHAFLQHPVHRPGFFKLIKKNQPFGAENNTQRNNSSNTRQEDYFIAKCSQNCSEKMLGTVIHTGAHNFSLHYGTKKKVKFTLNFPSFFDWTPHSLNLRLF